MRKSVERDRGRRRPHLGCRVGRRRDAARCHFHSADHPVRVSRGLRRTLWFLTAATVTAALVAGAASSRTASPGSPGGGGAGEVAIFYYPWYGTAAVDGGWQHWQQNGNAPPAQIASSWFPARGAYSSSDAAVVRAQMREIASIGVQTVIVSWWGPGSVEAARLPLVARAARAAGLPGRAARRAVRGTDAGVARAAAARLRGDGHHRLLRLRLDDERRRRLGGAQRAAPGRAALRQHVPARARPRRAGSRASTPTTSTSTTARRSRGCARRRACTACSARPSVGPGYDAVRATGDTRVRRIAPTARRYDRMWRGAIRAAADVVTITSYNEWHEGTQIEPASAVGRAVRVVRRRLRPHGPGGASAPTSTARRCGCARYRERARPLTPSHGALVERGREPAAVRRRRADRRGRAARTAPPRPPAAARARRRRSRARPRRSAGAPPRRRRRRAPRRRRAAHRPRAAPRAACRRAVARAARRGTRRPPSRDRAPANSATTRPSRNAFTAGMPLTENRCERARVGVDVDLDELDRARSRSSTAASSTGASAWHGPHHSAQKSTSTGRVGRPRDHVGLEGLLGDVHRAQRSAGDDDVGRAAGDQRRRDVLGRDAGERAVAQVDLDRGPARRAASARAPSAEPISSSSSVVKMPAPARLAARDPLELAQLLERVDPHVRVRADAERDRRARAPPRRGGTRRRDRPRSSGRRRCALPWRRAGRARRRSRASRGRSVVAVVEAAGVGEQLDRAAAVLREALLDLARLLVGVDVERQPLARRVAADLLEPVARAGAHGVGGDADGDPGVAERLDLVEVGGDGRLAHPVEAAALVGDVEQHDRDPGVGGGLGGGERLGERRGSGTRRRRCSRRRASRGRPRRSAR